MKRWAVVDNGGRVTVVGGGDVPEGESVVMITDGLDVQPMDWHYKNGRFVHEPTPKTASQKLNELRAVRDAMLDGCDWTQQPDVPISEEDLAECRKYRQGLRDITKKYSDLDSVVWPVVPSRISEA